MAKDDTNKQPRQEIIGIAEGRYSAIAKVRQICKEQGLKIELVKCVDCTPAPGADPRFKATATAVPILATRGRKQKR